jgi:hypothetical protein
MGYVPPDVDDVSHSRAISATKQTSKFRGVTRCVGGGQEVLLWACCSGPAAHRLPPVAKRWDVAASCRPSDRRRRAPRCAAAGTATR